MHAFMAFVTIAVAITAMITMVSGTRVFSSESFLTHRNMPSGRADLEVPQECALWRSVAKDSAKLHLYAEHFTSLDFTDWYTYVSFFNEQFHAKSAEEGRRPRYLDIAANSARRWSNTWFFDRCMGWDGVCVEANPKYKKELLNERHCYLIDTCVSDRERTVEFAFTDAYGGVIKSVDLRTNSEVPGVDGHLLATAEKFKDKFQGIHRLKCTTVANELSAMKMEGHIDFMSLDVEGHELPVLEGINWNKTKIDVIVIENKALQIVQFFETQDYRRFAGVLKDDIYIRKGSGYKIDLTFANWLTHLNKTSLRIALNTSTSFGP